MVGLARETVAAVNHAIIKTRLVYFKQARHRIGAPRAALEAENVAIFIGELKREARDPLNLERVEQRTFRRHGGAEFGELGRPGALRVGAAVRPGEVFGSRADSAQLALELSARSAPHQAQASHQPLTACRALNAPRLFRHPPLLVKQFERSFFERWLWLAAALAQVPAFVTANSRCTPANTWARNSYVGSKNDGVVMSPGQQTNC